MGVVGLLHQRAEETRVVGKLSGQDSGAEVEVSEQAGKRVGWLVIGCGGEEALGHGFPMRNCGEGEVILALEVVKEAALGDAGLKADIVDGGRSIPFGTDGLESCVEELVPRLGG